VDPTGQFGELEIVEGWRHRMLLLFDPVLSELLSLIGVGHG
jgi:hypothetical protein